MNIERIILKKIELKMKHPFRTKRGSLTSRPLIIVEAHDRSGLTGYGEVTAFPEPFYTYETTDTAWHILKDFLIPLFADNPLSHPEQFQEIAASVHGHPMAKAGLEGAVWDLYAKQKETSLSSLIGGTRKMVQAGAVLSLSDHLEEDITDLQMEGFERYKLKIIKGKEQEMIESVRAASPDLPIMIDGNGQYDETDMENLTALDRYGLLMIEQPFRSGDFHLHQQLQKRMQTSICLDESVTSYQDAVQAVGLGSCRIINVKISRVGGLAAAKKIHDFCAASGVPVWCGGMVESGISKAHNLALASLPNFTIPGDLSGSTRYFEADIVKPPLKVQKGALPVPQGHGIGIEVDEEKLAEVTQQSSTHTLS
ncbi:o-succinylbenzoate synthase [Halobacillus kuroshimensis]|uniref:o-succinylbenzoate synthase n=1 Tax=Halobacillus kuroshimensis TaxID=302481 RepID=UPI0003FC3DCD|nr:o-succinylbenzoate synthase [Halobacillus kuroshimensis]